MVWAIPFHLIILAGRRKILHQAACTALWNVVTHVSLPRKYLSANCHSSMTPQNKVDDHLQEKQPKDAQTGAFVHM